MATPTTGVSSGEPTLYDQLATHTRTELLDYYSADVAAHATRISHHLDAPEPSIRDLLAGTRVITDLAALAAYARA